MENSLPAEYKEHTCQINFKNGETKFYFIPDYVVRADNESMNLFNFMQTYIHPDACQYAKQNYTSIKSIEYNILSDEDSEVIKIPDGIEENNDLYNYDAMKLYAQEHAKKFNAVVEMVVEKLAEYKREL